MIVSTSSKFPIDDHFSRPSINDSASLLYLSESRKKEYKRYYNTNFPEFVVIYACAFLCNSTMKVFLSIVESNSQDETR